MAFQLVTLRSDRKAFYLSRTLLHLPLHRLISFESTLITVILLIILLSVWLLLVNLWLENYLEKIIRLQKFRRLQP